MLSELIQMGIVKSPLKSIANAPLQGNEGGVTVEIEVKPEFAAALNGLNTGDEVIILTWLHLADRDTLQVNPRNDPNNLITGVFATRSPNRPNPIGLHKLTILNITGTILKVAPMEAIDGTPVIDIKSAQ